MLAMLPGRFALGVRLSRGRSPPGGFGAGPGFMNCSDEYMLPVLAMVEVGGAGGSVIEDTLSLISWPGVRGRVAAHICSTDGTQARPGLVG